MLKTLPAKKLLQALSQYGGYLVDDTAWNSTSICTEHGVADEFMNDYGFSFTVNDNKGGQNSNWYEDLLLLFRSLYVVVNNDESNIGGGGTPIAPLAPPFC